MKKVFLLTVLISIIFGQSCQSGTNGVHDAVSNEKKLESSNNEISKSSDGVITLSKAEFLKKVMNYEENPTEWVYEGNKPSIVDFYADWCAPCRMASPILDELAREYAGKINIYKVDTEKERELASVFGVRSLPSFLIIPMEGKPSMSSGIGRTKEETRQMFREIIEQSLLNNN